MVAIDTNILVRRIVSDHAVLSPQATQMLEQAKPGSLLLDRVIIEELGYVLHSNYGFDKQRVADVYRSLLREAVFYITDRELTAAAVKLFVSERPLSFEDCWLLALKRAGRVGDVLTFDAALQKRVSRS